MAIGIIDSKSKILQFINKLNEAISKLYLFLLLFSKFVLKIFIGTVSNKKKIKKIKIICKSSIIFAQHNSNYHVY